MNLIEPCILGGAVVGAVAGAVLGFSTSPLWGLGGLVAGVVVGGVSGPLVFLLLGLLIVGVTRGPRELHRLLRELLGPRHPPKPG